MPRYILEVSQPQAVAARRIRHAVATLGSHFATHADWRHHNGIATGTMVVEAEDRARALAIVPPPLRPHANVAQLKTEKAAATPHPLPAYPAQPNPIAA